MDRDSSSMQKKPREAMRRDKPALNCPLVTQRRTRTATDGRAGRTDERGRRGGAITFAQSVMFFTPVALGTARARTRSLFTRVRLSSCRLAAVRGRDGGRIIELRSHF